MKKTTAQLLVGIGTLMVVLLSVCFSVLLCYLFAWIVLWMFPNIEYSIYQITFVTYIVSLIIRKITSSAKH